MQLFHLIRKKQIHILCSILTVLFIPFHFTTAYGASLPFGSWNYTVYCENKEVGSARIKRSMHSRQIHTESELSFLMDKTFTVSQETIIEESSFSPVAYTSQTTFVTTDAIKRINMNATIDDNELRVSDGKDTLRFNIKSNINFGTNILLSSLLKAGLKPGNSGTVNMYDPTILPKKTIKTSMICDKEQEVQCRNHTARLHKITVTHKNKTLYTMFADKSGVIHKYIMHIQDNKLELVLSAYDSK